MKVIQVGFGEYLNPVMHHVATGPAILQRLANFHLLLIFTEDVPATVPHSIRQGK